MNEMGEGMDVSRQLEEVLSWRFITEFYRRYPKRFRLIEAHPGGGQYDCLVLIIESKEGKPAFAIDVNRGGSVHVHHHAFGNSSSDNIDLLGNWVELMLNDPRRLLDEVARKAGLALPKKLPASTPAIISYRFITEFLTHSIGRLETWHCRNGFFDTSEAFGGGRQEKYFRKFPSLTEKELRLTNPFFDFYEYNFWFLLKGGEPVLCLDTLGRAHDLSGHMTDLTKEYKKHRKIWPLITNVASDLLP